jgi:hypothetical protein
MPRLCLSGSLSITRAVYVLELAEPSIPLDLIWGLALLPRDLL